MVRYYLVPVVVVDAGPPTKGKANAALFFHGSGIRYNSIYDEETSHMLVVSDITDQQHQEAIAVSGVVYVGPVDGLVVNRAGVIAAGYPADPGESVKQLIGEIENLIWIAKRRYAYHTALRAFGLDPASRPTKAQEVIAARGGMKNRPPLNELPVAKSLKK